MNNSQTSQSRFPLWKKFDKVDSSKFNSFSCSDSGNQLKNEKLKWTFEKYSSNVK